MKAKDPIFAPIPYGDDRQVTRTRRGLDSICDLKYDPTIVYCTCHSCNYQWEVSKDDYVLGTGSNEPNASLHENTGYGGTGSIDFYHWTEYGQYDSLAHDCCTGGIGLCAYVGHNVEIGEFYPLTGCTGASGELIAPPDESLLGYNTITGELTGSTGSKCLGDSTSIYMVCVGQSGDPGPVYGPRTFGGYPLVCPNCCRVNFEAKYLETHDNPGKEYAFPSLPVEPCHTIMVIDFQRIKSDFAAG